MAIAKTCDLVAVQIDIAQAIVDQDEIVSRAVHFCETQHDHNCSGGPPQPQTSVGRVPSRAGDSAAEDSRLYTAEGNCRCQMAIWRLLIPP